jgi:16S rRNA (guanine966-N2)-methyltransferase
MLDRVRQAVFDRLGPRVVGARVLDLYAGSGALGIEALSRGAESCLFVDQSPRACRTMAANLARLGLMSQARIWRHEAQRAVGELARQGQRFHLVFVDPPYGQDPQRVLLAIGALLEEEGILVLHRHRRDAPGPSMPGLASTSQATYGQSWVGWFQAASPITAPDRPAAEQAAAEPEKGGEEHAGGIPRNV